MLMILIEIKETKIAYHISNIEAQRNYMLFYALCPPLKLIFAEMPPTYNSLDTNTRWIQNFKKYHTQFPPSKKKIIPTVSERP